MYILMVGTGFPSLEIKLHIFLKHTAVLKGIVVFFFSTYSPPIPVTFTLHSIIFRIGASALRRVRFFVVGKRIFLTARHSRAPPSGLDF